VDASVRQFCATAKARLQACTDFDANRQFLVDHVERVIYDRYNVTVTGSVPVQGADGTTKLPFRIKGKIDITAVRSASSRRAALAAMVPNVPVANTSVDEDQPVAMPLVRNAEVARV
jgi:hypothetical protein